MERKIEFKKDVNPRLHKTFWFWAATVIPLIVAIFVSYFIYTSEAKINYNFAQLNEILNFYRVPVGIAGLSIPFVAVIAAIHRSSQTANQIDVQREQNNFTNHFKHLEEFKKAFSDVPLDKTQIWDSLELLHMSVYPESINGNFSPSIDIYKIKDTIDDYIKSSERRPAFIMHYTKFLSNKLRNNIITKPKIISPAQIVIIYEAVELAIRFSALNTPIPALTKKQRKDISRINVTFGLIKQLTENPSTKLKNVVENGLESEFNLTDQVNIERLEKIIVAASAIQLLEKKQDNFKQFIEILSNEGKIKLVETCEDMISHLDEKLFHFIRKNVEEYID